MWTRPAVARLNRGSVSNWIARESKYPTRQAQTSARHRKRLNPVPGVGEYASPPWGQPRYVQVGRHGLRQVGTANTRLATTAVDRALRPGPRVSTLLQIVKRTVYLRIALAALFDLTARPANPFLDGHVCEGLRHDDDMGP